MFLNDFDYQFMNIAVRLSKKHSGLTGINPSVAAILVRNFGRGSVIVGRGITEFGGRPHAESQALQEAGENARGATAYVTLEPCAHYGKTPSCAEALVRSGIVRVVGALKDPDQRVSGKGYAILKNAGVQVIEGVLAEKAQDVLSQYLIYSTKKRPEITLKIALSADMMMGAKHKKRVIITGSDAQRQAHLMRASVHALLIGVGTSIFDDPQLTVRLPGLENRSPIRIILDPFLALLEESFLVRTARKTPVWVIIGENNQIDTEKKERLTLQGVKFLVAPMKNGRIILSDLMKTFFLEGISSVLIEGGAQTARLFLQERLVDRIVLFQSNLIIGKDGIQSPIYEMNIPDEFMLKDIRYFGKDRICEWVKVP